MDRSDYDFVVIGGGIAGVSASYELAAHGRLVLLEREPTLAYHTTGRSAALFTESYNSPLVSRLAASSRRFLESPPPQYFDTAVLAPLPLLFIARHDQRRPLDRLLATMGDLVPGLRAVDTAEAARLCPALRRDYVAGGVLEPGAMAIDVHALHQGFARGVRQRGGEIRTGARVDALSRIGDLWIVRAAGEKLRARIVVNAAGAWADQLGRMAGTRGIGLVPMRRTAFTFTAPDDPSAWPMVVDVDEEFYFKPEGPQLLASPADETPMDPQDARPAEIDVALGIERIQRATTLTIRSVRSSWAGLRSFVADREPVAGMDPDLPGFFWLAGQGGFGILTSPALARAATGLIMNRALPGDLADGGITIAELSPARLRAA